MTNIQDKSTAIELDLAAEQPMRILVVGGFQAGSQYAHAINTVKMAQGFARLGHDVAIVCRDSDVGADVAKLNGSYGLSSAIKWILLPAWAGEKRRFAALAIFRTRSFQPQLVYARNYCFPTLSSLLGIPTVAESHAHPSNKSKMFKRMVRATNSKRFQQLVTISDHLSKHYQGLGVPAGKLNVLPDAVDPKLFARPAQLPPSPYDETATNVVYAGHLYDYKGIPTVLDAAQELPNVMFHFVGGWPADRQRQEERAAQLNLHNVMFHGMQPHADVPRYLWHADALLLPPSQNHPSAQWTSPVKLGEYLASEVPVIATRIPALEAWVNGQQVEFSKPDCGKSLADAIERVLNDEQRRRQLVANGQALSMRLSYRRRAQSILDRVLPMTA